MLNFEYLYSGETRDCEFNEHENSYINSIASVKVQKLVAKDGEKPLVLEPRMSLTQLAELPLPSRLRGIIVNTQVASLDTIKRMLGDVDVSEKELVESLLESSVVINGIFVAKSELTYIERPFYARQYLLKLFLDNEYVSRQLLVDASRLPPEMAVNMLKEVASFESSGWKLLATPDYNFKSKYPDIIEIQSKSIQADAEEAIEAMKKIPQATKIARRPSIKTQPVAHSAKVGLQMKDQLDLSGIPIKGTTLEEQGTQFIKKFLALNGPCSASLVTDAVNLRTRDLNPKNLIKAADISPEWIQLHLDEMGTLVQDAW